MNASNYVAKAREWSRRLEDGEAQNGLKLPEARQVVARKVGVAPGTLERLRKGRLKAIGAHVYERLYAAVLREMQSEMRRLSHEVEITRQCGLDPRSGEVAEVEADLARLRHEFEVGGS